MNFLAQRFGRVVDLVGEQSITGRELQAEVARRAPAIAAHCRGEEDRVVIAHGNSTDFFADLLAVWQAGACAVCVNQDLTPGELANVVSFVEARAVLVHSDVPSAAVDAPYVRTTDSIKNPAATPRGESRLDDDALILFTSGTTGNPKGVVHSHRSLQARIALNHAHIGTEVLARSLCVLPTHFGHGLIGNCLTPLLAGGDVHLFQNAGLQRTAQLAQVLEQHQISFMSSVPTFWKLVLRIAETPPATPLQRVHIGSAPLAEELWQDVVDWTGTQQVVNAYGITETANWIGGASAQQQAPESGLVGTLWGGEFAVLQDDGKVATSGEGEVLVRSPSLMTGYFRQPELTAHVLKDGWYHTGDIGELDNDGCLRMTGRNKFCINRAGMKIYPEELDLLLEQHPAIAEACAFAVPDEMSHEAVAIALQLQQDAVVTDTELLEWTRQRIRTEAVPQYWYRVAQIPKTDRGKINRDRVAEHCLSGSNTE